MILPLNPLEHTSIHPWDPGTGQTWMGLSGSRGDHGDGQGLEKPFLFFVGELREVLQLPPLLSSGWESLEKTLGQSEGLEQRQSAAFPQARKKG